ncbi:DinB family protein [Alkalihalobacillus trypoxylicola]|uniref:Squalene--hopene cyclase n=1 Tax=Alkalihalobacillus trypoxylicola TaxID=519424 RepID=A0A161PCH6_9BACI|nr:DinB family protein [Alkalihalobacillus trypoxylicola]KYG30397.1 squalene--hopene cyclase [Alkalihalobacillus trypoxylicola]
MRPRPVSIENPEQAKFVSLVPDGDIEEILSEQRTKTITLLSSVSEETASKAYAPGKWTLKEVIGHMTDSERVMSYRMLAIARNESEQLPAMDQNQYVAAANFNKLSWEQLLAGLDTVRSNTLSLISTIDDAAWVRQGTVMNSPVSLAIIAYGIAGHELHHRKVITDKYL